MLSISDKKQNTERHTASMFCVAILTWLEICLKEFAVAACHPRASSRFIANLTWLENLNEKRLQRKTTQTQWLVALIAKVFKKTIGEKILTA